MSIASHPYALAIAVSLPWIVTPIVTAARSARSRTLRDESPDPPHDAPLVSVIVPARNESRNIAGCLAAVLATSYPALEVVVVDDHSTDDTRDIARTIAGSDPRVLVISNPDLPAGWFGKQWACQNGAAASHGAILIFVDADTRMAPDLIPRSVNGMLRTGADLYSVIGRQDMHTFWERLIQPQIFSVLAMRYGGTETVNRSRHARDKIANGQYLMLRREPYERLGGHALVRSHVAEDLMLAQKVFAEGRKTVITIGLDQLSTRMYTSLRELIDGWRKNVFAGGRDAMPFGRPGKLIFPLLLLLPELMQLMPVIVLLLAAFGLVSPAVALWSAIATTALLASWLLVYRINREPIWYALCFPVGASLLLYIMLSAIARGSNVQWKGRAYRSGFPDRAA